MGLDPSTENEADMYIVMCKQMINFYKNYLVENVDSTIITTSYQEK